jgi:hypothetical protein
MIHITARDRITETLRTLSAPGSLRSRLFRAYVTLAWQ